MGISSAFYGSGGTTTQRFPAPYGTSARQQYVPLMQRGAPERLTVPNIGGTGDPIHFLGMLPARAAETPIAFAQTALERAGVLPPSRGTSPKQYQPPGFLEDVMNFSGSIINASQMGLIRQWGDKPDSFVIPDMFGRSGAFTDIFGNQSSYGVMTVGELKQQMISRGVLFDVKTGQEITWAQLVSDLKSGRKNDNDFGHIPTGDSPLGDLAARTILDPLNWALLGGPSIVKAAFRLALPGFRPALNLARGGEAASISEAITKRGAQAGFRTGQQLQQVRASAASADNYLRGQFPMWASARGGFQGQPNAQRVWTFFRDQMKWGPKDPPMSHIEAAKRIMYGVADRPVGLTNMARTLYELSPVVRVPGALATRIVKRAANPFSYIRSPQDYIKSSLALQLTGHAVGNLSWSVDQMMGGRTPFAAAYEFMTEVESNNPLSENTLGILLSASAIPYGRTYHQERLNTVSQRVQSFGPGWYQEIGAQFFNDKSPQAVQNIIQQWGGPEKANGRVIMMLLDLTSRLIHLEKKGKDISHVPGTELNLAHSPQPLYGRVFNDMELGNVVAQRSGYLFNKLDQFLKDGTITQQTFRDYLHHVRNSERQYDKVGNISASKDVGPVNTWTDPDMPVGDRMIPFENLTQWIEVIERLGEQPGELADKLTLVAREHGFKEEIDAMLFEITGEVLDDVPAYVLNHADDTVGADGRALHHLIYRLNHDYPTIARRNKSGKLKAWERPRAGRPLTLKEVYDELMDGYDERLRMDHFIRERSYQEHALRRDNMREGTPYDGLYPEQKVVRLFQLYDEMDYDTAVMKNYYSRIYGREWDEMVDEASGTSNDFSDLVNRVLINFATEHSLPINTINIMALMDDVTGLTTSQADHYPISINYTAVDRLLEAWDVPAQFGFDLRKTLDYHQTRVNTIRELTEEMNVNASIQDSLMKLMPLESELAEISSRRGIPFNSEAMTNFIRMEWDKGEQYLYHLAKTAEARKKTMGFIAREAPITGPFFMLDRAERIHRLRVEYVLRGQTSNSTLSRRTIKRALDREIEIQKLHEAGKIEEADVIMLSDDYARQMRHIERTIDEWKPPLGLRNSPHDFTPAEIDSARALNYQLLRDVSSYSVVGGKATDRLKPSQAFIKEAAQSPWAAEMIQRRTLLGTLLFDQGWLVPFSEFAQHLWNPVKGSVQATAARQALFDELIRHENVSTKQINLWLSKLDDDAATIMHKPGGIHIRYFQDAAHLPAAAINKRAVEVWGPDHPMFAAYGGIDQFHLTLDRATSRFFRSVKSRVNSGPVRGRFARATHDMYRRWQGSQELKTPKATKGYSAARVISKQFYFHFRFMLDARWHLLNMTERYAMFGMKNGIAKDLDKDIRLMGPNTRFYGEQSLHRGALTDQADTGWFLGRPVEAAIMRSHEKLTLQRTGQILDELRDWEPLKVLRDRWRAELETQLADGTITPEQFALQLADWKDSLSGGLNRTLFDGFDKKGVRKTIDDEVAKYMTLEESAQLSPLIDKLYQMNADTWRELNRMITGNPQRRTVERVLNSFWLYWPISYQIKALKWLGKTMLDGSFGHNNNALLAGVYANWRNEHERKLVENPGYAQFFEENRDLWFMAQMVLPIAPWDISLTLSRPFRAIGSWAGFFEDYAKTQDPWTAFKWFLEMGPIYTATILERLVKAAIEATTGEEIEPTNTQYRQPGPPSVPQTLGPPTFEAPAP